jgi:hypothetical protein
VQPGGVQVRMPLSSYWYPVQESRGAMLGDSAMAVVARGAASALATPTVPASSAAAQNPPARCRMPFQVRAVMMIFSFGDGLVHSPA